MKVKSVEALRKFIKDSLEDMYCISGVNNNKEFGIPFGREMVEKVFIQDERLPEGCKKITDHIIKLNPDKECTCDNLKRYCIDNAICLELTDGKYGDPNRTKESYYIDVDDTYLDIYTSKNGKGYFESVLFRDLESVSNRTMLLIDIVNWMNSVVNR